MDAANSAMGCYVLIVVSEPASEDHKQIILQKLSKGLLSWDVEATGCDLTGLQNICSSVRDKNCLDNDVLIQYSTETLGVEVLVNPSVSTLKQCIRNLLESSTFHKHLIHAGYAFSGSGSWILGNGTFSFRDFLTSFQDAQVGSPKVCKIHVHCTEEGEWSNESFSKEAFAKVAEVLLNPSDCVDSLPGSEHLIDCLRSVLNPQSLDEILIPSPLVGNVRFNKPTIYVFPSGEGDCALFGVKGFNMIINGGFGRKPCCWEFIRHLDRVDAVLVTHLSENNLCGISTLMHWKTMNNPYPNFGYVFCNVGEGRSPSPISIEEIQKDKSDLLVSVVREGHKFVDTLNELKLRPHQCLGDNSVEPIILYHKVGDGTLEMHVLNPTKGSKEVKDFICEWNSCKEIFSSLKFGVKNKGSSTAVPLPHATSICAILVWRPSDPKDPITRILFSGSTPQSKILANVEKLKNLDILKQPVVTKASLSEVIIAKSKGKIDKPAAKILSNRKNSASPSLSISSVASRNGDILTNKKESKDMRKPISSSKKDNKDMKKDHKEPKKDGKDIKQQVEKKAVTTALLKKPESVTGTPKSGSDAKRTTPVRKPTTASPKKDISKSTGTNVKSVDKHDAKRPSLPKRNDTKSAKDVSNKKAAEAKSLSMAKIKSSPITDKLKTDKNKYTPVPKVISKVSKTSLSIVSTAAIGASVASPLLSEAAKEKEISVAQTLNETDVKSDEAAEEEKNLSGLEVTAMPQDAAFLTPTDSISPTPSDTLSSAPLEAISPTSILPESSLTGEEKNLNEMKDIIPILQESSEGNNEKSILNDVTAVNAIDKILPLDSTGGSVQENAIEKEHPMNDESKFTSVSDQTAESCILNPQYSNDFMSLSFTGACTENPVENETASKLFTANEDSTDTIHEEGTVNNEHLPETQATIDGEKKDIECEAPVEGEVFGHEEFLKKDVVDEFNDDENDAIRLHEIDLLLAGATMEGSICEGYGGVSDLQSDFNANNESILEGTAKNNIDEGEYAEEIDNTIDQKNFSVMNSCESPDQSAAKSDTVDIHAIVSRPEDSDLQTEESTSRADSDIKNHISVQQQEELQDSFIKNRHENNIEIADTCERDSLYTQNNQLSEKSQTSYKDESEFLTSVNTEEEEQERKSVIHKEEIQIEEFTPVDDQGYLYSQGYSNEQKLFSDSETFQEAPNTERTKEEESIFGQGVPSIPITQNSSSAEDNYTSHIISREFESEMKDNETKPNSQICEGENENTVQNKVYRDNVEDISDLSSSDQNLEVVEEESNISIVLDNVNFESTARNDSIAYSEDDVDINSFMVRDTEVSEGRKLSVKTTDSDSDDDVVKSPTPHAFVVYEGHSEGTYSRPEEYCQTKNISSVTEIEEKLGGNAQSNDEDLEHYLSEEKQDFNEKDRDSAEEEEEGEKMDEEVEQGKREEEMVKNQEKEEENVEEPEKVNARDEMDRYGKTPEERNDNDGIEGKDSNEKEGRDEDEKERESGESDDEMIRHPTPPGDELNVLIGNFEGNYTCDNMRDPITQHFISSPRQGSDVTDEPLYEEPEDTDSESSSSPVVEQPIYGNVVEVDFPEFVNVSGTTTPSEPQSPKGTQDTKSKGNNLSVDVMEALSEHDMDYSESSVCRDEPEMPENCSYEEKVCLVVGDDQAAFNVFPEGKDNKDEAKNNSSEMYDLVVSAESGDLVTENILDSSTVAMKSSIYGDFDSKDENVSYETHFGVLERSSEYAIEGLLEKHCTTINSEVQGINHGENENQEDSSDCFEHKTEALHEIPEKGEGEMSKRCTMISHEVNESSDSDEPCSDHEECELDKPTGDDYSVLEEAKKHQIEEVNKVSLGKESFYSSTTMFHETSGYTNDTKDTEIPLVSELNGNGANNQEGYVIDNDPVNPMKSTFAELPSTNGVNTFYLHDSQQLKIINSDLSGNPDLPHNIMVSNESPKDSENCHLPETSPTGAGNIRFPGSGSPSFKFYHDKEDHPYGESSEDEDSSSLPGNVSPYAYTNKAYAQEEEEENNEETPFQTSTNNFDACGGKALDGGNLHPMPENFPVDNSATSKMLYSSGLPDISNADSNNDFHLEEWGKPMGLPTPPEAMQKSAKKISKSTAATKSLNKSNENRSSLNNGKHASPITLASKSLSSPLKGTAKGKTHTVEESSAPVYVDLAYVPHHGDPYYCDVEFFKKIRARYYVFSGINPSKEVLNALLEGKKSWNEDIEVTIIPTYETDTLGYWMAQNQDALTEYSIDVAPSASRCTVNLQDHETSCAAYRLEF